VVTFETGIDDRMSEVLHRSAMTEVVIEKDGTRATSEILLGVGGPRHLKAEAAHQTTGAEKLETLRQIWTWTELIERQEMPPRQRCHRREM
jgi:hypothetical protein